MTVQEMLNALGAIPNPAKVNVILLDADTSRTLAPDSVVLNNQNTCTITVGFAESAVAEGRARHLSLHH